MSTLKRVLSLTLALAMAMSVGMFAVGFEDGDEIDPSCVDAVNLLTSLNIINGIEVGDGEFEFQPTGTITRAQAAKMIY